LAAVQAERHAHDDLPPNPSTLASGREVVVAASSAITRWGLRAFIDHDEDLHVAEECATLTEVVVATLGKLKPGILLLGSSVTTPPDLLQELNTRCTVVVFMETDDIAVAELLRMGVRGFVDRRDDVAAVTATLTAARSGVTALNPRSLKRLLGDLTGRPVEAAGTPPGHLTRLGGREREVLACLGQGWSNRQIGNHLYLTEGTVKGYVSVILSKLGLSNRTTAALHARTWGLQPPCQTLTSAPTT